MSDFLLTDLDEALRAIGRGVVFQSLYWDQSGAIALTHLGDTEGDIVLTPNETYVSMTTPELRGNAKLNAYLEGEDAVLTLPLYVGDPTLVPILGPTASYGGGYKRRRPVTMRTLAVFPEELMYNPSSNEYEQLSYSGGNWTVGGSPLTARQQDLLDLSVWVWRGYFAKPPVTLRHAEGGKAVESVTFQSCVDQNKPDGHQLYTRGDPNDHSINLAGGT